MIYNSKILEGTLSPPLLWVSKEVETSGLEEQEIDNQLFLNKKIIKVKFKKYFLLYQIVP
jgi:hypothetical protein